MIKKILLNLSVIFLLTNNTYADISGAEKYSRNFTQNIFNIITAQTNIDITRDNLVKYIKKNININWTAKFVLGKNWKKADQNQKQKFTSLFEDYLVLNYAPKFTGYNNETYKIVGTKELAPKKYITMVELYLADKTIISVDLFILEKNNQYKTVDIAGEGISFAATQRSEFGALINEHGFAEFLTILEQKVSDLKNKEIATLNN